jgi:hypothetical protein
MSKIWIYLNDVAGFTGFKEIDSKSPKLEWDYKWAPPGTLRYTPRTNSTARHYVNWGNTKKECADKENRFVLRDIKELEHKIEMLKKRLVTP